MSAQPVHCSRVTDTAQAARYLRRDVLKNRDLLAAIERNFPPVPREIWAAKDPHGNMAGLMLIENFPHGPGVEFRAEPAAALAGLLRCLEPGKTYAFAVPADLREEFLKNLPHAKLGSERIDLTLSEDSFHPLEPAGEARPLTPADKALIDSFPPDGPHEPPLGRYVEWAAKWPAPPAHPPPM